MEFRRPGYRRVVIQHGLDRGFFLGKRAKTPISVVAALLRLARRRYRRETEKNGETHYEGSRNPDHGGHHASRGTARQPAIGLRSKIVTGADQLL